MGVNIKGKTSFTAKMMGAVFPGLIIIYLVYRENEPFKTFYIKTDKYIFKF